MTRNDILVLDTIDTSEYINGELSDEGASSNNISSKTPKLTRITELDIPPDMVPPNPDESDSTPNVCH